MMVTLLASLTILKKGKCDLGISNQSWKGHKTLKFLKGWDWVIKQIIQEQRKDFSR